MPQKVFLEAKELEKSIVAANASLKKQQDLVEEHRNMSLKMFADV